MGRRGRKGGWEGGGKREHERTPTSVGWNGMQCVVLNTLCFPVAPMDFAGNVESNCGKKGFQETAFLHLR